MSEEDHDSINVACVGLFAHLSGAETVRRAVEFSTGGDGTFDGTYRAVSAHTTPADIGSRNLILTDEGKIDFSYGYFGNPILPDVTFSSITGRAYQGRGNR